VLTAPFWPSDRFFHRSPPPALMGTKNRNFLFLTFFLKKKKKKVL